MTTRSQPLAFITFIKGIVLGGALAAAALTGYAYGDSDAEESYQAARSDLEARCTVRVGYGSPNLGGQCFSNQVVVGARNDYLLCADLQVDCP